MEEKPSRYIAQADIVRFFKGLSDMAIMFADELSKDRQRLYWESLRDRCTIEEWEYAVGEAMARETFHKVPLPQVLMEYVREYRRNLRELHLQAQAEAGTMTRQRLLALREALISREEIDALIRDALPDYPGSAPPPTKQRRLRLSEEELHYEPTVDPEVAKAKLREDFRKIIADEEGD